MDVVASASRGNMLKAPPFHPVELELFTQPTEPERLEAFKALDYETYKAHLLVLHEQASPYDKTGFTSWRTMVGPAYFGLQAHRYPDVPDKDAVLAYGLAKAQAIGSLPRAAFIAAASVYLAHPFANAHKRTARNLYLSLMTGLTAFERVRSGLVRAQTEEDVDYAMNAINVSSAFQRPEVISLVDRRIYTRMGLQKIADPLRFMDVGLDDQHSHEHARVGTLQVLENLPTSERNELLQLVGWAVDPPDDFNPEQVDVLGITYALSALRAMGTYTPQASRGTRGRQIILHEALKQLSLEDVRVLIKKAWEYHRLQAEVGIDLLASDETIEVPYRGRMSTYDFILERSAHFGASRITNHAGSVALFKYLATVNRNSAERL